MRNKKILFKIEIILYVYYLSVSVIVFGYYMATKNAIVPFLHVILSAFLIQGVRNSELLKKMVVRELKRKTKINEE